MLPMLTGADTCESTKEPPLSVTLSSMPAPIPVDRLCDRAGAVSLFPLPPLAFLPAAFATSFAVCTFGRTGDTFNAPKDPRDDDKEGGSAPAGGIWGRIGASSDAVVFRRAELVDRVE